MAKITVMFGNDIQSEHTLEKDLHKIGRAVDCDIVVDNLGVSRHHLSIAKEGDAWVAIDGGSNNGTFVNGGKITKHTLKDKDRIVLGKHSLIYDHAGSAAAAGAAGKKGGGHGGGGMGGEMTMFVDQAQLAKMAQANAEGGARRMALALSQGGRDVVIPLLKEETTIGKGMADIPAKGFLVKPLQAKVMKIGTSHRIVSLGGFRAVKVNGAKITDHLLKQGDVITIASTVISYRPA